MYYGYPFFWQGTRDLELSGGNLIGLINARLSSVSRVILLDFSAPSSVYRKFTDHCDMATMLLSDYFSYNIVKNLQTFA